MSLAEALRFNVLTIDIETRPNLAYVWGLWDQNVGLGQIAEVGSVICFAAKWQHERKVHFHSDHHDGHQAMLDAAWHLIDEADAIVGYNSKSFDMKHLMREFVLADMPPPSPWRDIDLLTAVKSRFRFVSNKLDHVASELGLGSKVKHSGFDLWLGCMADDPKAWATMKRYNIGDVKLTEAVYDVVRPWIKNHPHVGSYVGDPGGCPNCGVDDREPDGVHHTNTLTYARYRCRSCGAHHRDSRSIPNTTTTTRAV